MLSTVLRPNSGCKLLSFLGFPCKLPIVNLLPIAVGAPRCQPFLPSFKRSQFQPGLRVVDLPPFSLGLLVVNLPPFFAGAPRCQPTFVSAGAACGRAPQFSNRALRWQPVSTVGLSELHWSSAGPPGCQPSQATRCRTTTGCTQLHMSRRERPGSDIFMMWNSAMAVPKRNTAKHDEGAKDSTRGPKSVPIQPKSTMANRMQHFTENDGGGH